MTGDSLISIIVPIYKVEKYLHKCVDSILAQTYTNIEVILIDDDSSKTAPAPVLGDNVELGFGATVIGDVYIADGCKIGAVVTKSCYEPYSTLVGFPRVIHSNVKKNAF